MATRTPPLQTRSQFGAYWGAFANTTLLPNASGAPLAASLFVLEAGDVAFLSGNTLFKCDSPGTAGGGDATWSPVDAPVLPGTTAATLITLTQADDRSVIRTTAGTTVVVAAPPLRPNTYISIVQEGLGQVQVTASGGTAPLQHPADFFPYAAQQFSPVGVLYLTSTLVQVLGDLAPT